MAQQDNSGIELSNVCIICKVEKIDWKIYRISKELSGICHDCVCEVVDTVPRHIPQAQHHRYIKRVLIKRREYNEQTM